MEDEVILCIYVFYIFDLFSLKQVAGSSPTNSSLEITHVSRAYDVTIDYHKIYEMEYSTEVWRHHDVIYSDDIIRIGIIF